MHVMRRKSGLLFVALIGVMLALFGTGQTSGQQGAAGAAAQKNDAEYAKRILDNTPDKRILTELVDHVPVSATVPSPLKFLGYVPGENNRLTYHKDIVAYYQALAKASPRVKLWEIGKSEEGRAAVALAIADEATIKALDKYKQITAQLTDPRKLTDAQAKALIQTGKPIYYATGSIHSGETGSPEMLLELAYRLAVEESPFIRQIRNNIIVVITPVSEVDGHERQVDNRRAQDAGQPQPGMTYWGRYVAHDNNRDGIGKGLALSQYMLKSFLDLHPQVFHDLHESVTLLYTSTGTGPYYPDVAPIQVTEWWWLAQTEIMEMTKRGVPGVWTYNYYDGWVPNYMFWIGVTHNSIGRFYETQSYGGGRGAAAPPAGAPGAAGRAGAAPAGGGRAGAPAAAQQAAAPAAGGGEAAQAGRGAGRGGLGAGQSREWYRPYPVPPEGVQWSGRANINMQQSAILIAMNAVAKNTEMFLENYYVKNKMMIEKGRTRAPFAYVVPAEQRRRIEAADLMNALRREAVEVHTATAAFAIGKNQVAAGDYIVRLDQPYGGLANTVLGTQWYPEQNPRPYDDTGWSLPLLRNVKAYSHRRQEHLRQADDALGRGLQARRDYHRHGRHDHRRAHERQRARHVPVREREREDVGGRAGLRRGRSPVCSGRVHHRQRGSRGARAPDQAVRPAGVGGRVRAERALPRSGCASGRLRALVGQHPGRGLGAHGIRQAEDPLHLLRREPAPAGQSPREVRRHRLSERLGRRRRRRDADNRRPAAVSEDRRDAKHRHGPGSDRRSARGPRT